jgi:carbamoyltransferase
MILGLSAGFHDAAISLIDCRGDIVFAGHSERYSKVKNDPNICKALLDEVCGHYIDTIAYYERPIAKQLRQLYSGQGIEWNKLSAKNIIYNQCAPWLTNKPKQIKSYNHHLSHAAAGFQTSKFTRATVVVIDAIGEWDTISIWGAEYNHAGVAKYTKLWGQKYPHSIGLFYSAMTKRVNLKPNEDEYILMGMSAYGKRTSIQTMQDEFIQNDQDIKFKQNFHIGDNSKSLDTHPPADIAAGAQAVIERLIYNVMHRALDFKWSNNLVYMGGVALNCLANRMLGKYFDNVWIMPNPGDAGSSLGAAALAYGRQINWQDAFLGHNIPGAYPVNGVLDELLANQIVGVASGRAEFGPRALGNRSLLADPRGADIKNRVNDIKQRQKFRPFAPVILAEMADQYFDFMPGWLDSRYMQSVAWCKSPDRFPAVCHVDGTSRVQTVPKDGSGLREVLEKWFVLTDCPMLLNTSLNIKGEPMVNDRHDATRFQEQYGIKVLT